MSSGMARGWAHIGVMRALNRLGFEFDIITGCSVGALGGRMLSRRQARRARRMGASLNKRKIVSYLDMRLRSGGLIGGDKLVEEMRKYIGM
jgi:NTE family protein